MPSAVLLAAAILTALLLVLAAGLWLRQRRQYRGSASVASAYDRWTEDQLLERLWGDHVHLGYYGTPARQRDFRQAKVDFVHELVHWSGLDQLPAGSRILDVGCGIGGSARILARDYGFEVLGVSISPAQIARAQALTPVELQRCRFAVMDALRLDLADAPSPECRSERRDAGFDAVWSVEASPHMPDKQRYCDEMLRVLRPGGLLAIADWNRRDPSQGPMNARERWVMRQLLEQWAHPEFASIPSLRHSLESSPWSWGLRVETADWSEATQPSWIDSIAEGLRRPGAVLGLGPGAVIQGLRETPTLLLMDWAFRRGLMRFGVFKGQKGFAPGQG
ncbi:MAG: methyltransferase domain-containing protein [Synechococcaceae cyanobacterium]